MSLQAMHFRQLSELFQKMYELSKKNVHFPIIVWGEAGIGKSEAVRNAGEKIWGVHWKDHVIDLRLGQMDAADLIGLPTDQKVFPCPFCAAEGLDRPWTRSGMWGHLNEAHAAWVNQQRALPGDILDVVVKNAADRFPELCDLRTAYSVPEWFPSPGSDGILFLDELNRTRGQVLQAVFQLLLDRRIHEAFLPKRWIIVAASNPYSESYRVDEQRSIVNDRALQSRFIHLAMTVDTEEWLSYINKIGVAENIQVFLSMAKNMILPQSSDAKVYLPEAFPTPRSIEIAGILLEAGLSEGSRTQDWLMHVLRGTIGASAADKMLDVEKIEDLHRVEDLHNMSHIRKILTGLISKKNLGAVRILADDLVDMARDDERRRLGTPTVRSEASAQNPLRIEDMANIFEEMAHSDLPMVLSVLEDRLRPNAPQTFDQMAKLVLASSGKGLRVLRNDVFSRISP